MTYDLPRQWDFQPVYKRLDGVFDADQCAQIVGLHADRDPMVSEMTVDSASIRSSDLYWLPSDETELAWIYDRVREVVVEFNARTFQFEIDGCMDMQLTRYGEGQHYDWHADLSGLGASRRKLSVSVLLNAPKEFDGGDIQYFESDTHKPSVPMARGDAAIFPSWYKHRVLAVTRGVRWSLVSWWTGPPFR